MDNLTMEEMAAGLIMSMEARGEKPGWVCEDGKYYACPIQV